tara:strand:- start:580 stop:900 length:321 start_codon:yes stop_codon:yes gene_type:complete
MKITKSRLRKIIKEEIERAAEGLTYSQYGGESGRDDDAAVELKGYQDALTVASETPREYGASIPGEKRPGMIYLYDGGWDTGLAQLLQHGDITQEEYDVMLSPPRS